MRVVIEINLPEEKNEYCDLFSEKPVTDFANLICAHIKVSLARVGASSYEVKEYEDVLESNISNIYNVFDDAGVDCRLTKIQVKRLARSLVGKIDYSSINEQIRNFVEDRHPGIFEEKYIIKSDDGFWNNDEGY